MPELPELEVIKNFLESRIINVNIQEVIIKKPLVFRCLLDSFRNALIENKIIQITRKGKFLIFKNTSNQYITMNLMLSGRLQYTHFKTKINSATCFQIRFENDQELRYFDQKLMGRIYLVTKAEFSTIPQFMELGVEPLSDNFSPEQLQDGLKRYWGMVKNTLRNQHFIAGIGNAYSDEILFHAGINPLRKSSELSPEEVIRLFDAIKIILKNSIEQIQEKIGVDIHIENREFMKVHNRGGKPCFVCGTNISELTPDGELTNFCRGCQK
jgi:formamidopyrimidine-DNA glycosylase